MTNWGDEARPDSQSRTDFDHNSSAHALDRANSYARLREQAADCPFVHSTAYGGVFFVLDWDVCGAVLSQPQTFSSKNMPGIPPFPTPLGMTQYDPPAIESVRKALNQYFVPARAEMNRARARELADAHLDRVVEAGHADLVSQFTRRVPASLTMELLGLPVEQIEDYVDVFQRLLHPGPSEDRQQVLQDYQAFLNWIGEIIDQRRAEPRDDWISLFAHGDLRELLTRGAIVENVNLLLAGGIDTTTNVTAFTLLDLHTNRDLRDRLRTDPSVYPRAFEEYVRVVTPQQGLPRLVTRDAEIGGYPVRKGDVVYVALAAANRDPQVFAAPNNVDVERRPNRHIAFGRGIHQCIGRHFARVWWEEMVGAVLRKIPDYDVSESQVKWAKSGSVNGVVHLPVTFSSGKRV